MYILKTKKFMNWFGNEAVTYIWLTENIAFGFSVVVTDVQWTVVYSYGSSLQNPELKVALLGEIL